MTDVAVRTDDTSVSGFEMKPRTLSEAMRFCEIMAESELVPKDYKGKPGNILVAIQLGMELGMTPMRALKSIAVINGRAALFGDEMLAMVLNSPLCEYVNESESTDTVGICKVKRKGYAEHVETFTLEDAKRAGLLGKPGPWTQYTGRMLKLRARGFALRDVFADVLAGMITAEEALDIPPGPTPLGEQEAEKYKQTLKDRLKSQLEASAGTDCPPNVPLERTTLAQERSEGQPVPQQAPHEDAPKEDAPANFMQESSAVADYEAALEVAVNKQEVDGLWADCMKDKRISSESRQKFYKKVQAKAKALKAAT